MTFDPSPFTFPSCLQERGHRTAERDLNPFDPNQKGNRSFCGHFHILPSRAGEIQPGVFLHSCDNSDRKQSPSDCVLTIHRRSSKPGSMNSCCHPSASPRPPPEGCRDLGAFASSRTSAACDGPVLLRPGEQLQTCLTPANRRFRHQSLPTEREPSRATFPCVSARQRWRRPDNRRRA